MVTYFIITTHDGETVFFKERDTQMIITLREHFNAYKDRDGYKVMETIVDESE
jgi:hypothetical protein